MCVALRESSFLILHLLISKGGVLSGSCGTEWLSLESINHWPGLTPSKQPNGGLHLDFTLDYTIRLFFIPKLTQNHAKV